VGQALTGVLVEMANLSALIRSRDPDAVAAKAGEIKKLLENSISVVRNMALLLRASMLDDLGLLPALQWQAREVSERTGIRVTIAARRSLRRIAGGAQDLCLPYRAGGPAQLRAARWRAPGADRGAPGRNPAVSVD
jgi:signal transduction histidine kinase